ncbi:hypothetical protein [Shewanella sediminis]|uniref:hypothetical protein n=1 Tax=Shewanella sediminis TaxID=271097 RepID=UPI0002F72277|nr:hypothetical protein [Shewanella sediminis]
MFIKEYLANLGIFFNDSIKRVLKAPKMGEIKGLRSLDIEALAVENVEPVVISVTTQSLRAMSKHIKPKELNY